MILSCVENSDEDADDALGFHAITEWGAMGIGKEGAGEVADGGYDDGEIITAVPEAVVGCLVAEDLGDLSIASKGI